MQITTDQIEVAAKALWDKDTHPVMERAGYPTDWDNLPESIKRSKRREVRLVLKVLGISEEKR